MDIATIGHNSRIPAFAPFFEKIEEIKATDAEAAFDYEDPAGNKAARSHIHTIRLAKGEVERARKKEKEESLAYGRRVDEQAKAITAEFEALIARHEKPIKEIEQREKDRIAEHEWRIEAMERAGQTATEHWQTQPLDFLQDSLANVEGFESHDFEEFTNRADYARKAASAMIREAISKREAYDAEQARLAQEKAEQEAREREEREERIAAEAAERARVEAETKAREEQEAAARREQELKEAAEQAERDKAAAEERAANAARETEERIAREAKAKADREIAEAAAREANKKHRAAINNAAVDALVAGGLSEAAAKTAITLIAQKAVPAVTITY